MKLEEKMMNGIQNAAAAFEERIKALLHDKVDHVDRNVTIIKEKVSGSETALLDANKRLGVVEEGMLTVGKGVEKLKENYKISKTMAEQLAYVASLSERS